MNRRRGFAKCLMIGIFSVLMCFSSYAGEISTYIEGNRLVQAPIAEHDGVTVIPQGWRVEEEFSPCLVITFRVENRSGQTVRVTNRDIYLNGQSVNVNPGFTGAIAHGKDGEFEISIEEFQFVKQRIEKIHDLSASFFITYQKDDRSYYTDPGTVQTQSPSGQALSPVKGAEIYSDENVKVTAESALREFPGAYAFCTNVENRGSRLIHVSCSYTAVNGKATESGDTFTYSDDYMLFPGKTADVAELIYLKDSSRKQILPQQVRSVTWKMSYGIYERDEETPKWNLIEEHETEEITVPIGK